MLDRIEVHFSLSIGSIAHVTFHRAAMPGVSIQYYYNNETLHTICVCASAAYFVSPHD